MQSKAEAKEWNPILQNEVYLYYGTYKYTLIHVVHSPVVFGYVLLYNSVVCFPIAVKKGSSILLCFSYLYGLYFPFQVWFSLSLAARRLFML